MKILSIHGSPKENGNSSVLLREYIAGALLNEGVQNETVFLQPLDIKPCTGCDVCKTANSTCIVKDDMTELYDKVIKADVLVFATPIYWWHMSAQLKTFLDRLYAMDLLSGLPGKRFVLLMTYDGEDPNSGAQLLTKTMEEITAYLNIEMVLSHGVCTSSIPMKDNISAQKQAFELGKQLC